MTELFDDLVWRGLVHQVTDPDLAKVLAAEPITLYHGIDPSADSLQFGNLLGVLTMLRFQRAGHRPIYLAGGGTGMVGDPGGKTSERSLLDPEELKSNLEGIRRQLERFLDFEAGPNQAQLVDNGDWLYELKLMDFLREVGKHVTVNSMIAKESVRARLEEREQGISYTEFSYMLLQAFDYVHLFDSFDCRLQLGGSDQWGNITAGIDLIRRMRGATAYGLTWPLLTDPAGVKLGKSEGNSVWLDPKRTSPYQLFQYLIRSEDTEVGSQLRSLTFLDRERIEELDVLTAEAPERREAQRVLAHEVTAMVHGEAEAERAQRAAEVLFTEEISGLDEAALLDVFSDAPSTTLAAASLSAGLKIVDLLAQTRLVPSKTAARKTIEQGGVYVNNRRVSDVDASLTSSDALAGGHVVLRKGKKEQHLLRFT